MEQPKDTPILFAYEILDVGHEINLSLHYGALALKDLLITEKKLVDAIGHVEFIADNSGFYSICMSQSESYEHPSRVKLTINYGYDSEYYEELSKKHGFDAVKMEIHKLNDMMTMTLNEADYQKHKEVEYHAETEEMDSAALWWPMLQIGILAITGIFQVQYLKFFFKSNKLI